jgi:hypothetical protein
MKKLFKNTFLFLAFLLWSLDGSAQLYPVQLTPIFNSPYSVKISDYATSMETKMQLLIHPTDISISQRQVRLKLYIQGNGINIQTSDYVQGQRPIFINGGELQTLTNIDISALFRLENMQGITALQYANPLPEGMYSFCFEMYDFITNQKISQKSCASLYLILNDPPLLNTPQRNEQIAATEFPNILFTWTPRQINATNVSYKYELKQITDPNIDPQFGFLMAPLLHEETLFGTALLYNLAMPTLTPGMRYAWRVKAISTTGLSENAVFKNDGYSEIFSFKYTGQCLAPTFPLSEAQGPQNVRITWQGVPQHTRYQIQYKKQGFTNARWFSTNSLNTQSLLSNLEPGVTYEFRVGSSCDPVMDGIQSFTYSSINTFTTPTQTNGVPAYNCGITPNISIKNQNPITNLIESETFTAGDFPVKIVELRGKSPYSGKGYIIVPYLGETKIAVTFDNIFINTDYQLISGIVETSYDPTEKNIIDGKDIINDVTNLIDSLSDAINGLKDLLDKDKIDNQEQFNKAWNEHVETIEKQKQLLFETGNLPQHIKDEITKTSGNTFLVSTDKGKTPTLEDFPEAKKEVANIDSIKNSVKETEDGLKNLIAILKNLDTDTFIKCKQCEEQKTEKLGGFDGSSGSMRTFSYYKKAYVCLIASLKEGKEISILTDNLSSAGKTIKTTPEISDLVEATKTAFNNKQDLLAVIGINNKLVSCEVIYPFSKEVCGGKYVINDKMLLDVSKELEKCYYSDYEPKLIAGVLKEISKNSRTNQGIEFVKGGKVYKLNGKGEIELVKIPLTDDDIRNGKWTDGTVDVKIRVTQNKEGIFRYQAVGIRNNLALASGKTANLKDLSVHIENQGNAFFQKYKVNQVDLTPAKAGVNLNKENEVFADGKKIALDNNTSFFKISSEGIGLLNSFLQTALVEEPTYLASTENTATIHAPGLVTGTVESGATVVTDITSLCSMVYDLSTDDKTRTEMYTGLVKLKDAVKDDPSGIIPIFVQILSGNTNDEWAEMAKGQTDDGRRGHLYSRGVVTSVKSVIVGGTLITKLPKLADELVGKIKTVKGVIQSLKHFDIAGEFAKGKNVVLNTIEWGTKSFKLKWERVGNKITFGDRSDLAKILGTTDNIEAHHIMPWKICEGHEIVQLAALDGFHPNLVENGIGLEKYTKLVGEGMHGNHPAYDAYVRSQLDNFKKAYSNITPEQANKFLQESLIPDLKNKIVAARGTDMNLNQYFKTTVNPGIVPKY